MSSGYTIFPLGPTFDGDETPIIELGFTPPEGWQEGRTPKYEDFRDAFADWDGCSYEEKVDGNRVTIYIESSGEIDGTEICINRDAADQRFYFLHGSSEWLVTVTKRLAHVCGPFLLAAETGEIIIVSSGTDPNIHWLNDPRWR
jgi:hypothetical protein